MARKLSDEQQLQKELQSTLAQINEGIERAKVLANRLQTSFTVLDRTYNPLTTVTQGGKFDYEAEQAAVDADWEGSFEYDWNSSNC